MKPPVSSSPTPLRPGAPDRDCCSARTKNGEAGDHDRRAEHGEHRGRIQSKTRQQQPGRDHRHREEGETPAPQSAVGIGFFDDHMPHSEASPSSCARLPVRSFCEPLI